MRDFRFSWSKH